MLHCKQDPRCLGWPNNCTLTASDPDIAGIGVIISFVLTALITITASIIAHFIRPPGHDDTSPPPAPDLRPDVIRPRKMRMQLPQNEEGQPTTVLSQREMWNKILDDFIRNLSDQQLGTSLAILITAFIRQCQISNYHLNIVCDLAWFSTVTHLLSVIVLRVYWMQETKRVVLHIRIFLMFTTAVMLCTAMVFSSPIDPIAGNGACPAHCSFDDTEINTIFYGGSLSFLPRFSNYAGLWLFIIIVWGYATTALFVWPWWWSIYSFFLWDVPQFFISLMCFIAGLAPLSVKKRVDHHFPLRYRKRISKLTYYVWRFFFFPWPTESVIAQIFSWGFALVPLRFDRWGGNRAVLDPHSESQWGFGQLLVMIIVLLPVLPLLETWSGHYLARSHEGARGIRRLFDAVVIHLQRRLHIS